VTLRTVAARTGARLPVLGQGTWRMGEDPRRRRQEADALRLGLDLGLTLVDTAEMYAAGKAEEVVGDALQGRRESVFLVTKVLPENASYEGTMAAAERSLRRLRTDRIDLYLLHWESPHPFEGTLRAFEALRREGKILHHGVSNFDLDRMGRSERLPGGSRIAANQVYYSLQHRGIERRLVPRCRETGVVLMAYSPLEQGRLEVRPALEEAARRHAASPQQVALAWTIREPGVMAIVKSAEPDRIRANRAAADLVLTAQDLAAIDAAYPSPAADTPLETL
jgi:diketogulonate reductase-like aldo/keto reductase